VAQPRSAREAVAQFSHGTKQFTVAAAALYLALTIFLDGNSGCPVGGQRNVAESSGVGAVTAGGRIEQSG
jgi:hypothetical protein